MTKLTNDLRRKLLFAFQNLNEECYYMINHGGCGLFAETAYIFFSELGFKPKILVFARDKHLFKQHMLRDDDTSPRGLSHVFLKIDSCYIDSEGIFDSFEELVASGTWMSSELNNGVVEIENFSMLCRWNDYAPNWNPDFERRHGTQCIQETFYKLKTSLRQYETVSIN